MKIKNLKSIQLLISIGLFIISTNCFSNTLKDTLSSSKKSEEISRINVPQKRGAKKIAITKITSALRGSEFTDGFIKKNYPVSNLTSESLSKAIATCKAIDENENVTDLLETKSLSMLPLGIKKTIGGIQYMLGISNAKFTPEYTELTAFVRIILPQIDSLGKQKELFFGANNIKLSHKGGLVGDTNLVLLGDFPMKLFGDKALLVLKGGMDMQTGEIQNKTYVTIDCNGFKELGITADVEFSRTIIEPVGTNNEALDSKQRVKGSFKTIVSNWNDILIEISLPNFQLTNYKGTCFQLNKAVIDLSDLHNSKDIKWPKNYEKDYLVAGNEQLWRGLYVQSLKIILPPEFKNKDSNERIVFKATDLLIDRMGVSGNFSADNVLDLGKGTASGWQFSVTHIEMGFRANSLTSAGFEGGIVLPVTDTSMQCTPGVATELGYKAIINPIDNEYLLKAEIKNDICFQLFKANATLEKNSYVELKVKEGVFLPKAVLYGSLAIKGSNKTVPATEDTKETVNFKGITFQNLQLQTVVPYIKADYFGYKNTIESGATVSNFPITINEIALIADDVSASLKIDMAINLMKDQFHGETKFYVVGKFAANEGIHKWKFDHLKFEEIKLAADLGGVKFKGSITIMDNDPIYGNGFKGMLGADFTGGISVEANAIFGSTSFRYWYVDAVADNLNIPAGAITFKGFGGGASYRMKKDGFSSKSVASGSNYVPDFESGLGVKAMIKFAGSATTDSFWGGAGFEIAFNSRAGINRVSIYGEGHVMQPFEIPGAEKLKEALKAVAANESLLSQVALESLKTSNLSKAAELLYPNDVKQSMGINAFAAIEYDFRSSTLHGSFDVYIDTPGGFIKGRASQNRAGWAVLHFAPDKWYIRLGTPTDRLGLKMAIGPIEVEAGGYFMIGDDIPASPPPPSIVAQILKLDSGSLDYTRSENASALGSGKGFAFGSDFSMKTGDMKFLIFYANFQAGLGFDIMVKDYGAAQCKGSGQIGINGWYANGQSYAYLQGELGINIKLFFIRKKIAIIKGGGAVVLQAKLPNPVWIRGYLGGYFDLLGGAVKGSFRFKLEFGEQCEFITGSPLEGLKSIADITPNDGVKEVNVFTVPQVGFNMPVGKNFNIEGDNVVKTYRLKLEECAVKKDGVPILGQLSWNDTKDLVSFNATDILPQNSNLSITATVSFQENVNGTWKTIYDNGQIATETEVRNFTTGTAPNNIPVTNIAYCYPVFDQKYVYQNETKQAYVVLKQGQPYLFDLKPGQSQKAFYKTADKTVSGKINYDNTLKKVTIDLPALQSTKEYSLSLMTLEEKTDANANLSQNYEKQNLDTNVSVEIKSNKLKEAVIGGEGTELLQYKFNTSDYNTFQEKMAAKRAEQTLVEIIYSDVHALHSMNSNTEPFDEIEISGNSKTLNKPLVIVEAVLNDSYYTNEIYPLIYKGYPLEADFKLDRNTSLLGIPPTKGVEILAWYQDYLINNPNSSYLRTYLPFRYNQPYYYKTDFVNIRYKVVNKYLNTLNQNMIQKYDYLINGQFPFIKKGSYNIKLIYTLPGGAAGTSSIFTFNKSN